MLTTQQAQAISIASPWEQCLGLIHEKIGSSNYETWFRTIELTINSNYCAQVMVPNQFFADFIEEHFSEVIQTCLKECEINFKTISFEPVIKDWQVLEPITERIALAQVRKIPHCVDRIEQFHPNYTFDNYVIGDSNRMAHAAAFAVAEAPGKTTFNPLVVYGGTGLGKTHLLQAIGHFAQTEATAEHVLYLTSEEFTNQYISYVIDKRDVTSFYKKFKNVDLLLIDDIQFFGGKDSTQKEFFRIFNKLLLENKQIVLSSDRPPDQIPDMMNHIINRFLGGLIADIQPPNLEVRMAILQQKAEHDGILLPYDVTQYIAANITSNVRELEGTLIKLIASASFTGQDITLETARQIFSDVLTRKEQRITTKLIQQKVAEHFNISVNQFSAQSRKRETTLPRNIALYLCKKLTRQSLSTIGFDFSRDYSTVIYACKKIESELATDQVLQTSIATIEQQIQLISA